MAFRIYIAKEVLYMAIGKSEGLVPILIFYSLQHLDHFLVVIIKTALMISDMFLKIMRHVIMYDSQNGCV